MIEGWRRITVAASAALVLGVSACGQTPSSGSGGSASDSSQTGPAGGSPTSANSGGRYGYGTGGSGSGSDDEGTEATGPVALTVTVSNYVFTPSTIKVAAGDVIELKNVDPRTPHTFTVAGEDIDQSLDPGSSTKAAIDLSAGSYDFECRFHASQGMSGTLVVS